MWVISGRQRRFAAWVQPILLIGLSGGPSRAGSVDRMIAQGRRGWRVVGWTETMLRTFLLLDEPIEQRDFWHTRLDTWRFRAALGSLLSPVTLSLFYPAPLVRAV